MIRDHQNGNVTADGAQTKQVLRETSYAKRSILFSRASGCFALAIGIVVLIGWYAHWTALIQVLPNLPTMVCNTALGFVLSGTGLILLTTRHPRFAAWIGGGVAFWGALTLAEYLFNHNFGIDQLFLKDYLSNAKAVPGRMSPLTSSCFSLWGLSLVLTAGSRESKRHLTAIGILACMVATISGVALFGYFVGIETAYGWGSYTRMAAHTATTFIILSAGLLVWASYVASRANIHFLQWLPVTGSVTLMIMVASVSAVSFSQLKSSDSWRDHTYVVLATAQTFLGDILSIQRCARNYVLTGQATALADYQDAVKDAPQQLSQLKMLTSDNPLQQERIGPLSSDLNNVIAFSLHLIDTRNTQGLDAAVQLESTGRGMSTMNRIVADLQAFTDQEHSLLSLRSTKAKADSDNTERLLIDGSILAAFLLVLANLMAGRAMARQKELTHKAQSAERAKSEFLAIMSHEIRTPMNGVIGMTSILADTELNEMQRSCVSTISTSGESLMMVINDILDFSKIESGRMQLESRSFNLRHCVEEALDLFAAQIRVKRLEAVYLVAPDIPSHLTGDAMRLRQTLVNLIGNAIKFTAKGEIAINVECQSRDEEGYHLLFSVTDTGIGIPKEGIEKLFQPFQQVDTSTTRRYGGTGLGLVISKRLAEFMGGTMWVESKPGSGSTFFFSVTMKASDEPVPEHQSPKPGVLASHTVLVVDDNATNRRVLEIQLKTWGMKAASVSSGAGALKEMAGQAFDVVLIDFQMPDMDGVTLAKAIRRKTRTPLILLSSSGEIIVGEDANLFQIQIPKPIKHSHLFNALLRITGTGPSQPLKVAEKTFDHAMAANHPLRILLAEDNAVNQRVGQLMLSRLGYNAQLAESGRQAVKAVDKNTFDLILMDIQMPDMDGVEAARLIREKLDGNCPAIFALTAEALEGDKQRFLDLGFDGYLSKPLEALALQATLKTVKSSKPSGSPERDAVLKNSAARPDGEPFDEAVLRNLMEYGRDTFIKLIELFGTSAPTSISDMRRALEKSSAADLSLAAHTLKGSCSNFGAARLRELCVQIEQSGLSGNLDGAVDLVASAEKELDRLIKALKSYLKSELAL
jgi:signal transduction histidine kinase/DNA-binding response OmpR family regulator/HPt (histidine-containing phosphotransfer) domain-containing protein